MIVAEDRIAEHYGNQNILKDILDGLDRAGIDRAALRPDDLKPVDEFHAGGLISTRALVEQLDIAPETRVLDIGSGIGGTARYVAQRHGARVMGVDITEEYVEVARYLSDAVDLDELTHFQTGSATDLPVMDGTFDLALMLHVSMNVEDKRALFRSAARALAPGGQFALFEIMAGDAAVALDFPLPWAAGPETSFLATAADFREMAEAAGFILVAQRDRSDFVAEHFGGILKRIQADGLPPLGLHLLMGNQAVTMLRNYVSNLKAGRIVPCEMIFRKA